MHFRLRSATQRRLSGVRAHAALPINYTTFRQFTYSATVMCAQVCVHVRVGVLYLFVTAVYNKSVHKSFQAYEFRAASGA